jgi:hypothetical protein
MACGGSIAMEVVEEYPDETVVALILCRLDELRRAGCDGDDCLALAGRLDVDLGRASELVGRGCPPGLALRILV